MKTKSLLFIVILCITLTSCLTKETVSEVVTSYLNQTTIYHYRVDLYNNLYKSDSVDLYFASYDKYEAQKMFDEYISENSQFSDYRQVVSMNEITITKHAKYPYYNE